MHRKSKFWSCIKKNTDFYDLTREQQIDVFRFTNNFVEELTENKPSNIDSLNQALLELNLIQAKKEPFINYINTEHNIPTTKLRNYARDVNRSHDFRVLKIKEQLKELNS